MGRPPTDEMFYLLSKSLNALLPAMVGLRCTSDVVNTNETLADR